MNITFTLPRGHALGVFDVELPSPPNIGHAVRFDSCVFTVIEVTWDFSVMPVWVWVRLA